MIREAALLAAFIGAMALAGGRDADDAENIAQDEAVAQQMSQSILSTPCLYVCQKHFDHERCGQQSNTTCIRSADLTR